MSEDRDSSDEEMNWSDVEEDKSEDWDLYCREEINWSEFEEEELEEEDSCESEEKLNSCESEEELKLEEMEEKLNSCESEEELKLEETEEKLNSGESEEELKLEEIAKLDRFDTLGNDMMFQIFLNCGCQDLLLWRGVSKYWRVLLTDPDFISLYKKQKQFLIFTGSNAALKSKFLVFSRPPDIMQNSVSFSSVMFPDLCQNMDMVGSTEGVVCLADKYENDGFIVVWNPSSNDVRAIAPSKHDYDKYLSCSIGLGFDKIHSDFHIVRLLGLSNRPYHSLVEVYSLEVGKWREAGIIPFWSKKCNCSFAIEGVPFWTGYDYENFGRESVVCCFDANSNLPRIIDFPLIEDCSIVNWKDDIAAIGRLGNILSLYVLKHDEEDKWHKIMNIGPVHLSFQQGLFNCYKDSGDLLAYDSGGSDRFVLYDTIHNSLVLSWRIGSISPEFTQSYSYKETTARVSGSRRLKEVESRKQIFSGLYVKKDFGILMVGLQAAGKSTILLKLNLGEVVNTLSTNGFDFETVKCKSISIIVWDVGVQERIRPLWRQHFQNAQGLVFVIDSCDRVQVVKAKDELHRMLNEDELKDAVLLVLANKQDLSNAMNVAEISERLGLHCLQERHWHIQSTCATSGVGLYEGFDWLSTAIANKASVYVSKC